MFLNRVCALGLSALRKPEPGPVLAALRALAIAAALALILLFPDPAFAQAAAPTGQPGALDRAVNTIAGDGKPLSLSLQILLLMSLLTVLPSLVLMMTSFTRIIIVCPSCARRSGCSRLRPTRSWSALPCSCRCS
jgi:flagellar biosynthetic protein FliP